MRGWPAGRTPPRGADQSGRSNTLQQGAWVRQPSRVVTESGVPLIRLDGVDDTLLFADRLTKIRTVFWVIRESASATAGPRFLLGDIGEYKFHAGDGKRYGPEAMSPTRFARARRASMAP